MASYVAPCDRKHEGTGRGMEKWDGRLSGLRKYSAADTSWSQSSSQSDIQIAIFLAVLTAFLVPALQALSLSGSNGPDIVINNATTVIVNGQMPTLSSGPGSDGTSPPPLPPISDQIICMFYESALIVTVSDVGLEYEIHQLRALTDI